MTRKNQGEGDRESARHYNRETRDFLRSGKGKKAVDKVRKGKDPSEPDDERAETEGRSRAKEKDPGVTRDYRNPAD